MRIVRYSRYLPDFILGANDGVITTLAVVSGVVGAALSSKVIIILGFANLIADGFSMAASNILSRRSEVTEHPSLIEAGPHGLATFIGFVTMGLIPLFAYLWPWFDGLQFTVAVVLALLTLFVVGSGRAYFTGRPWLMSGMEMLLIGAAAAGAAYLVGVIGNELVKGN